MEEVELSEEQKKKVLADFEEWSGGFSPKESLAEEIETYLEDCGALREVNAPASEHDFVLRRAVRRFFVSLGAEVSVDGPDPAWLTCVPPLTANILRNLGLAVEDGKDDAEQRAMWGDETVDWLNEACKSPEYLASLEVKK